MTFRAAPYDTFLRDAVASFASRSSYHSNLHTLLDQLEYNIIVATDRKHRVNNKDQTSSSSKLGLRTARGSTYLSATSWRCKIAGGSSRYRRPPGMIELPECECLE